MKSLVSGLVALVAATTFAVQPTLAQVEPPPPAGVDDAASKPKEPEVFATPEQIAAAVKRAGIGCEAVNSQLASNTDADATYEIACAAGNGVIARIELPVTEDSRVQTMSCSTAEKNFAKDPLLYRCALTTPEANAAYDANAKQRYSDMAREAGIPCKIGKTAPYPARPGVNHEVVEAACDEGGSVVVMTGDVNSVLSCGRAWAEGYHCRFSDKTTWFEPLNVALNQAIPGGSSCKVNDMAPVGVSSTSAYLEVTCDDGTPGYIIRFPLGQAVPSAVLGCPSDAAKSTNGGCKLPANVKALAEGA